MRGACVWALCAVAFVACGGPAGSLKRPPASPVVLVTTQPNFNGSLKDLASQVTMNVILQNKGARFVQSIPFQPCPGEAGLQTFLVRSGSGHVSIIEVAFSNWSGSAVFAQYRHAQDAPYSKQALDAMRRAVCSS